MRPKTRHGGAGFPGGSGSESEADERASTLAKGLAERWIGSCRREIPDHVIALNEQHLCWVLREYVRYHHDDRLHDSLAKDAPNGRAVEQRPGVNAKVLSMERLGGLHHRYTWGQAA